nr:hypothetical protein [Tanacetum cinerariifolium]
MDVRSFMIQETISDVHPYDVAENIIDSYNISADKGELSLIGPDATSYIEEGKRLMVSWKWKVVVGSYGKGPHRKAQKVLAQASKVTGDDSSPLDVDSDLDIHEFPSAKELKHATNCHWVVAHDQELIYALHKARASCDTMREKGLKKDKAYAELEKRFAVKEAVVTWMKTFVFKSFVEMLFVEAARYTIKASSLTGVITVVSASKSSFTLRKALFTSVVHWIIFPLVQFFR